ncbi:MAG: response regulator transcription factor [Negativicutes bacterium]|nr:response regulator transcription factor [Negativicutes bacterium]
MSQRILLIEDNREICRVIQLELELNGYQVVCCHDGAQGYRKLMEETYDLLILDYMLPGMDGREILRRIKPGLTLPVIMLTARDAVSDKVCLLDAGADDYITKPFANAELLARIRARLRPGQEPAGRPGRIAFRQLTVDPGARTVHWQDTELELTRTEFDLLLFLLKNKNIVMTREQIINNVWGYNFIGDTNVVDVYVRYLRSKIDDRFGVKIISTVRGIGYAIKD